MPKKEPEIDYNRLCDAIGRARKDLERFRFERKEAVKQYIGGHWSENGSGPRVPMNLIALYTNVVGRSLIAKAPQMMASTFNKSQQPAVKIGEQWGNREVQKMGLADTLQRAVVDALYCLAIVKVSLIDPAHSSLWNFSTPAGTAFAERIDLDDFGFDTHARDLREASWMGHRYRVPKSTVENDPDYGPDRKKIEATDDEPYNDEGDEKISQLQRSDYGTAEEFEDMVELWEVYLPRHRKIVTLKGDCVDGTLGAEDGMKPEIKPLRVKDWIGPDEGPYHFLSFGVVPGNAMPKAPIQDLIDLHESVNELYLKLMRQGEDQKELLLYGSQADADVNRIRDASDGETVRVDNPDKIKVVSYRGPSQANLQLAIHLKDQFSYIAGNLDAIGGLSPQAKTLGQDRMLMQSASRTVTDMQETGIKFVAEVMKALFWFWWHDPFRVMQVEHQIDGVPESRIVRTLYPKGKSPRPGIDKERAESWANLDLQVDPYSMQSQTPQTKIQTLMTLLQQVIMPLTPAMQQAGMKLEIPKLFELLAKYFNIPELMEIVSMMEALPPNEQPGLAEKPGMAANTSRTYERTSNGGDSADTREKTIANMTSPTEMPGVRSPQ